jgi:hypothetical protein
MSLSKNDIINGESNLTGTRAEERGSLVQKQWPAKDEECDFCFFYYYTAKRTKSGDWVCCQQCNVWCDKLWFGAKGKMVEAADLHCTIS